MKDEIWSSDKQIGKGRGQKWQQLLGSSEAGDVWKSSSAAAAASSTHTLALLWKFCRCLRRAAPRALLSRARWCQERQAEQMTPAAHCCCLGVPAAAPALPPRLWPARFRSFSTAGWTFITDRTALLVGLSWKSSPEVISADFWLSVVRSLRFSVGSKKPTVLPQEEWGWCWSARKPGAVWWTAVSRSKQGSWKGWAVCGRCRKRKATDGAVNEGSKCTFLLFLMTWLWGFVQLKHTDPGSAHQSHKACPPSKPLPHKNLQNYEQF